MTAAIPGANRLRELPAEQIRSDRAFSRLPSKLRFSIDDRPSRPAGDEPAGPIPVAARLVYGAIAAFAVWLLLSATSPTSMLEPAQSANQVICGVLLVFFATAAAFGWCRILIIRYACTLTGVWLALSPLFLPGSFFNASIFGGLASFGAAGWAADAVELSRCR